MEMVKCLNKCNTGGGLPQSSKMIVRGFSTFELMVDGYDRTIYGVTLYQCDMCNGTLTKTRRVY